MSDLRQVGLSCLKGLLLHHVEKITQHLMSEAFVKINSNPFSVTQKNSNIRLSCQMNTKIPALKYQITQVMWPHLEIVFHLLYYFREI